MEATLQTEGQNILQHGQAVHTAWLDILNDPSSWPDCLSPWETELRAEIHRFDPSSIRLYHWFHDCGKPRCLTLREDGGRSFPDHALHSYEAWIDAGGCSQIGTWIRHDMDIHTISANEIPAFASLDGSAILLLTGLAEIRANAKMFGGEDSTSFKIKYKHWRRRALAYCKWIFGEGQTDV